jgi:RNA polymerase sigma factor (sigma-70 family)
MDDALLTRLSLLVRLEDSDDTAAWQQFVELYGRLVYGFARDRGLQDADAADLTQEVFLDIAPKAGQWRYDPRKGSFRNWLFGVTRHKLARFFERRGAQAVGGTDANHRLAEEPSPEDLEAVWEKEFRQQLFRVAAEKIEADFAPNTWRAFWRTAVDGEDGATVAAELGMSVGAVYVAKSRVLARLSEQIEKMNVE